MEKLTITRALKELSLLDDRITKKIGEFNPIGLKQKKLGEVVIRSYKTVNEFEAEVKANWESINSLIDRRKNLKQKIALSNATTKVKIVDKEMTVIEALEAKTVAGNQKLLLNQLRVKLQAANTEIDNHNTKLDADLAKMIEANTGKDRKVDKEDYNKIAEPFLDQNKLQKIDPINTEKEIEKISTYLEKFEQEVDIVLSESNAVTTIEI